MPVAVTRRRFTADDYQRMGQAGILRREDRVELIDGEIVTMTPIGPRHCDSVDRANRAFVMKAGDSAIVRVQGSVRLDFYTEPEPDLVLLRPRPDFYSSAHPGPADILLIVEIAETSIDYDRDVKSRVYAQSGVQEYWLADLNENVLTAYSVPEGGTYRNTRPYARGQSLAPQLLPECVVSTEDLLSE
jgi:Uma2 family endonuclease